MYWLVVAHPLPRARTFALFAGVGRVLFHLLAFPVKHPWALGGGVSVNLGARTCVAGTGEDSPSTTNSNM
jgi:hypothetical protein